MKKKYKTALAALFFAFYPCQSESRFFSNIAVLETGINTRPNDESLTRECRKFKPTPKQINIFLSKADPAPHRFGLHERYSPCYATGTAQYSGFGQINWSINSGGFGAINWGDDEYIYLFHKKNGWTDPVACTYGLGQQGEC